MGMDVIGLHPRRPAGEISADSWRDHWNEALEIRARCGEAFRANIWEWRAILFLCLEAYMDCDDLVDIDFRPWNYNDGAGFRTQRECDLLADALEELIRGAFEPDDPFAADPFFADFLVYIDDREAVIVPRKEASAEATGARYRTDGQHVWMWVAFLRNCGGFAIL